jgi:hypothetical protein
MKVLQIDVFLRCWKYRYRLSAGCFAEAPRLTRRADARKIARFASAVRGCQ